MIYSLRIPPAQVYNDDQLASVGDAVEVRLVSVDAVDDADAIAKMSVALAAAGASFTRNPLTGEPLSAVVTP